MPFLRLCVFLLLIVPGMPPGAVRAAGGPAFDHYLLALSVTSAFCEDEPRAKRRLKQCTRLSDADVLGLHGLWPSRERRPYPAFCGGAERGAFCAQPVQRLPQALRADVARAMPGAADCLDRHEWAKHGSCSGLAPARYFALSVQLSDTVEAALADTLRRHRGRSVPLRALQADLARVDPALVAATRFVCRTPRNDDPAKRRPMLSEIRVRYAVDGNGEPGRPVPLADLSQRNSGCPGGQAWIDRTDD